MAEHKVDGIVKSSQEETERKRRLVLESIGESRREDTAGPALPAAKKVDALAVAPKPPKPPVVPDLLKAAQKEDPAIAKEISEEKRKYWQAEISGIFASREKKAPETPPPPAKLPSAAVTEKAPEPVPSLSVSKVNPFKNEVMKKRIEEKKRLAEEAEKTALEAKNREFLRLSREEELRRREKAMTDADRASRREQERRAKETRKARRTELGKARRERWLSLWDFASRLGRVLPGRLWSALKMAVLVIAFGFMLVLLVYALFAVGVVKFDFDNVYTRWLSLYLPVPAYVGRDGLIDYYRYKDIRSSLAAQGKSGQELSEAAKSAVVEEVVMDGLIMRYGLSGKTLTAAELEEKLAKAVLRDPAINQVGLARIAKIKDMIAQSGDFVKVSNKYGDSQGQLTITAANRSQYDFYPALAALQAGQNSDILDSSEGYHVFRCFDRKGDDLYLSYVFVRAVTLSDHLVQETRDYWLWSLVD